MTESEWLTSTDPGAMLALTDPPGMRIEVSKPQTWRYKQLEISDRKLRLFAVACARAALEPGDDQRLANLVDIAERRADDATIDPLRGDAFALATCICSEFVGETETRFIKADIVRVCVMRSAILREHVGVWPEAYERGVLSRTDTAALLREIVGNPFRPVTLCGLERKPFHNQHAHVNKAGGFWLEAECPCCTRFRTPTVTALAQAAYKERLKKTCPDCKGRGTVTWPIQSGTGEFDAPCNQCKGDGTIDTGHLDPNRLAILADALEEAGCDNEEILRHLRGRERCDCDNGERSEKNWQGAWDTWKCAVCDGSDWKPKRSPCVRGCWATDCILGKE